MFLNRTKKIDSVSGQTKSAATVIELNGRAPTDSMRIERNEVTAKTPALQPAPSKINHRGLTNETGQNNCFLNVTIQALWHLGPFRVELLRLVNNPPKSGKLMPALCKLFFDYEFAELTVIPPDELRSVLSSLSDRFELGSIADSNEALELILEQLHTEHENICSVAPNSTPLSTTKCISHCVFGSVMLDQTVCSQCRTRSEPVMRNFFIHNVYAQEMINQAKSLFPSLLHPVDLRSSANGSATAGVNGSTYGSGMSTPASATTNTAAANEDTNDDYNFSKLLKMCFQVSDKSCPSADDLDEKKKNLAVMEDAANTTVTVLCGGVGHVRSFCLEPPLALALSVTWMHDRETSEMIRDFLSLISYTITLSDVFETNKGNKSNVPAPAPGVNSPNIVHSNNTYVFRGFVCYYGRHYVSIFQEYASGEPQFLLFDDHNIRVIGNWNDVKEECIRSLYQPVLLLYEYENFENYIPLTPAEQISLTHEIANGNNIHAVSQTKSLRTRTPFMQYIAPKFTRALSYTFHKLYAESDSKLRKKGSFHNNDNGGTKNNSNNPPSHNSNNKLHNIQMNIDKNQTRIISTNQNKSSIRNPGNTVSNTGTSDNGQSVSRTPSSQRLRPNSASTTEQSSNRGTSQRLPISPRTYEQQMSRGATSQRILPTTGSSYDNSVSRSAALSVAPTNANKYEQQISSIIGDSGNSTPNVACASGANGSVNDTAAGPVTISGFKSKLLNDKNTYHVPITPVAFREHMLVGIKFDTFNDIIVAGYFTRHPVTGEKLSAELSERIDLMDELVAVNEVDVTAEAGMMKVRLDILGDSIRNNRFYPNNPPIIFSFRRASAGSSGSSIGSSSSTAANKESKLAATFSLINPDTITMHSKTYSVVLTPEVINGSNKLGINFQPTEDHRLLITDFLRHPVTKDLLPAERCGRINLLDQVVAVNDVVLPVGTPANNKESWRIMESSFMSSAAVTNGVKLTIKSAVEQVCWVECPTCRRQIVVDSVKRQALIQEASDRNEEISLLCKYCNNIAVAASGLPSF